MAVTFGACRLDVDRRELYVDGRAVHLTPKAFELLRILLENRGRALSKAELFRLVWPGVFVSDDSLGRLVAELRGAIGDSARNPNWLRTIHGYGYSFAVADGPEAEPAPSPRFVLQCGSRQFLLAPGTHVIGRDTDSAVQMHSSAVSRRHASVRVSAGGATIEDLGSKNGTFIGDRRITEPLALEDGDRIRVGDFVLVFTSVTGMPTETLSP